MESLPLELAGYIHAPEIFQVSPLWKGITLNKMLLFCRASLWLPGSHSFAPLRSPGAESAAAAAKGNNGRIIGAALLKSSCRESHESIQ